MSGMSESGGVSVRVVNCREVIQELILRNNLSPTAATALGELTSCGLMMGSGLKDAETLQISLVGTHGLRNLMVITDGDLKVRGTVGNPGFEPDQDGNATGFILGEGQVQVVRNHPTWSRPGNGITALSDISIPLNLALYMAESEQRNSVMLSNVFVAGNLCRHALGVMVERLPGADDEEVERSVRNLEMIEQKGLRSYLDQSADERANDEGGVHGFRNFETALGSILDDALDGLGEKLRYTKQPTFRCSCGIDRVWRAVMLMPRAEIKELIDEGEDVSMRCEFCGESYVLKPSQIEERLDQEDKDRSAPAAGPSN